MLYEVITNAIANFAVRATDDGDYIGKRELEKQRQEFIRIKP